MVQSTITEDGSISFIHQQAVQPESERAREQLTLEQDKGGGRRLALLDHMIRIRILDCSIYTLALIVYSSSPTRVGNHCLTLEVIHGKGMFNSLAVTGTAIDNCCHSTLRYQMDMTSFIAPEFIPIELANVISLLYCI